VVKKHKTTKKSTKRRVAPLPPRPSDALTAKQERFCVEYVIDCNGTQAAIRSGCPQASAAVTASRWLRNAKVLARARELLDKKAKSCEVDAAWILRNLQEVGERCMQAVPVVDREGNPTGEYQFDSRGANRSFELLGKNLGMFSDKLDVKHSGQVLVIKRGEELVQIAGAQGKHDTTGGS